MKLSLAPLAYYWSKEVSAQFYHDALKWPVDIIYLGEVICSRRHVMRLADYIALAKDCRDAGKQAVISTLTLIDNEADRRAMHKLIDAALAEDFLVEANDFSAVRALQGKAFVAGPHLNIYHDETLTWLQRFGACRFTPPIECGRDDLQVLQQHRPQGMETELQVWGRMNLAYSARCFTARHHHLRKDNCEFSCEKYADGLSLATREKREFLNLNGIQTQSSTCIDLGAQLPELAAMGIDILRLQIQSQGMAEIVQAFDDGRKAQRAVSVDARLLPPHAERCNGYWSGKPGMSWETHTATVASQIP
ncbi:MAG: U32 family peptidase [Undibacterium sp.]|nr:U32 family peptidase [Undibacterium sp.]